MVPVPIIDSAREAIVDMVLNKVESRYPASVPVPNGLVTLIFLQIGTREYRARPKLLKMALNSMNAYDRDPTRFSTAEVYEEEDPQA